MPTDSRLPIHFFTIVLNGEPFIRYHLEAFKKLPFDWHWHVIEGLADLKHDTAWSLAYGASVPTDLVREGRSVDGTAEYLDQIARENPGRITLYRPPDGRMWDGKLEMISAPIPALENAGGEVLLWEVDSDELWTPAQLVKMRNMFLEDPARTAAIFPCWYFVGPNLAINRGRFAPEISWTRAWRYRPGMKWQKHEPPVILAPHPSTGEMVDAAKIQPFNFAETHQAGLAFQHYAYVTEAQLEFKEKYYGYKGISAQWKRMNEAREFPLRLKDYFNWPWVNAKSMVDPLSVCGIEPLAKVENGAWEFRVPEPGDEPIAVRPKRGILYVKWGPNNAVLERSVRSVREIHPELAIHVHTLPDNANLLDKATLFDASPFEETLFLDVDTVVLSRLDFGFEMAIRYGLACCICENPWARRYGGIKTGDMVEYNTGVLFFTRKGKHFFDGWKKYVRTVDSSILFHNQQNQLVKMPFNDQAGFSVAVNESPTPPFILPMNWNFRPAWHRAWWGPIKVWHDYSAPPPEVVKFTEAQSKPGAITQFVKFNG